MVCAARRQKGRVIIMGLFSRKEACPVCGGEVSGLSLVKIGEKKVLCKDCSRKVSMSEDLLNIATPEFIKEHLEYRRKNAERFAGCNWTAKFTAIPGFEMGIDEAEREIYLVHSDLHVKNENPVVLSFDQLIGYEVFRRKKRMDDANIDGPTNLDSGFDKAGAVAWVLNSSATGSVDYFLLKLATTDPYWKDIEIKIQFTTSQYFGLGGFHKDMRQVCQLLKNIVRREPLSYIG